MEKTIKFSELDFSKTVEVVIVDEIPTVEYVELANKIADIVVDEEGDMASYDPILLKALATVFIMDVYSNVDFEEVNKDVVSIFTAYDKIKNMNILVGERKELFEDTKTIVEMKITNNNSIAGVLSKSLNKLLEKIPNEKAMAKILKDLPKVMEKLSPANAELIKTVATNAK